MTIQESYEAIGGNYKDVLGRLQSEALIRRFTLKFLEDQSYLQLKQALENKNYEDAFRSAHTLKGVCQNLSFARLFESSSLVTKALKEDDWNKALDMMPQLSKDYHEIINAIEELKISKEE